MKCGKHKKKYEIKFLGVKQANTPKCIIDDTVFPLAMIQLGKLCKGETWTHDFYDRNRWIGKKKKVELCL